MKLLLIIALTLPIISHAQEADLLLRNGKIIDGTGNSWYYGDIAVKGNRILAIGHRLQVTAAKVIDVNKQVIAPGFIDVHTHIEDDERLNPTADNFIYDGVTSVITGNCGISEADLHVYLAMIDSLKTSVNVAALIGHNKVRETVMGRANRTPSANELDSMKKLVASAMHAGAVGFSTGLIYVPGTYSQTPEIIELARVAAQYQGIYATHMRNESDKVDNAIEEALTIGREAGIPVEISHFKVGGQRAAGRGADILRKIVEARNQGIQVTIDQYPYTASSTSLSSLLPDAILADGNDSALARLSRRRDRSDAAAEMIQSLERRGLKHYSYATVANYEADTSMNGLSIEAINKKLGRKHTAMQEIETIFEMFAKGGAAMVFHGMWEADVKTIMKYSQNMIASDASIRVFGKGVPHPRGYGSNARVLGRYVREQQLFSLEEAVRRMTSLPATTFHLKDRGLLREGLYADIVIFDPATVQDESTFTHPHAYSTGFSTVIVNGKIVVENAKHLGTRSGIALRRDQ